MNIYGYNVLIYSVAEMNRTDQLNKQLTQTASIARLDDYLCSARHILNAPGSTTIVITTSTPPATLAPDRE